MQSTSSLIVSGIVVAALAATGAAYAQTAPASRDQARMQVAQYYYTQTDQARRLIAEARRSAAAGDFLTAEQSLQDATAVAPGFFEIDRARTEIAAMRGEHARAPLHTRDFYVCAIDNALTMRRLGEANQLIAEGEMQYPGDPLFRDYRYRLSQLQAQTGWSSDVGQARNLVANARGSIARGDYYRAERELERAETVAPGLPEIGQTRAYLLRIRYGTD